MRAKKDLTDSEGEKRRAGQRWLVRKLGAYIPDVSEEIVEVRKGFVLTDKKSIWLRALKDMKDVYGVQRYAGAEWLIGVEQANSHILDVNEKFIMEVPITSLSSL